MADLYGTYKITTPRAQDPVALADVKSFMGISTNDDDTEITALITLATDLCEKYTKRTTINTSFTLYLDGFGGINSLYRGRYTINQGSPIELRRSILQSVTAINYYSGDVLTLLSSSKYYRDNSLDYARVFPLTGTSWPAADYRADAVQIEFVAGYGANPSDVPEGLKNAIKTHVSWLFEQRGQPEDCSGGLPANVKMAYDMYRIEDMAV